MKQTRRICLWLASLIAAYLPAGAFAEAGSYSVLTDDKAKGFVAFGLAIGAAVVMGIAALGGALGQGKAATAALEGIARNPGASGKIQTPMIIALALIESLVIFSFVIAFLLQTSLTRLLGLA
jgi:F-type H+-transporting ATPase subunit c